MNRLRYSSGCSNAILYSCNSYLPQQSFIPKSRNSEYKTYW